jgi:hypothetical protein
MNTGHFLFLVGEHRHSRLEFTTRFGIGPRGLYFVQGDNAEQVVAIWRGGSCKSAIHLVSVPWRKTAGSQEALKVMKYTYSGKPNSHVIRLRLTKLELEYL